VASGASAHDGLLDDVDAQVDSADLFGQRPRDGGLPGRW